MKKIALLPLLFVLLCAACAPVDVVEPTQPPLSRGQTAVPTTSIQSTATPIPANTPTSQPTATATVEPTPTDMPVPTAMPIPPDDLFPGMVFLQDGVYLRVDNDGELQTIFEHPDAFVLSFAPDGRYLAYTERESGDVYLRNLTLGTDTKILAGPVPAVQIESWWTAEPDWALLSFAPTFDYVNAFFGGGLPLLLGLDNQELVELVPDPDPSRQLGTSPAASPAGGQIAFDMQGEGYLYSFEEGLRPFNPANYGLTLVGNTQQSLRNPVFSPNGRFLAWHIKDYQLWEGYEPDQWEFGVAVFDLETGTAVSIPNFIFSASDHGYVPAMRWLDDETLIAYGIIFETGDPETSGPDAWQYRTALLHWPTGEFSFIAGTQLVQLLGGDTYLTIRELPRDTNAAYMRAEILIENLAEDTVSIVDTIRLSGPIIKSPDGRTVLIGDQLFDVETRTLRPLNLPAGLELVTWTAVN